MNKPKPTPKRSTPALLAKGAIGEIQRAVREAHRRRFGAGNFNRLRKS